MIATLATPSYANDFSLFGAYWDTDAVGETAGGGIKFGFDFNENWAWDVRATYYEELSDDPFEAIFDSDDPVFQNRGIQLMPVDFGLTFRFPTGSSFRPYLTGGGSYYFIDSDFGEIDDEAGWYGGVGAIFGDDEGASFYVEGIYRKAEAEVNLDPDDIDDIDDIDLEDNATFDIDGVSIHAGVRWSF